jgi:O-succinylbenzoic acid--CoA ligase
VPFLTAGLALGPDAPALVHPGGRLTYRDLVAGADDAARRLRALGVGRGDLVALKGELGPDYLSLLHGVWRVGAAVAPLHSRWTAEEERQALEMLAPDLVLLGWESLASVEPVGGPLPWVSESAVMAHLLTSGTSGRSRLVRLTGNNLLVSTRISRQRLGLQSSDRWLASLSPAHVGGLALVSRAALLGCALILEGPFRAGSFLRLAEGGAITHASLVPTMLHQLLEEWGDRPCPPSLQCLLVGGAAVSPALLQRALDAGLPIALTYGLTEATSQVATAPPALTRRKPGTVGPPLSGLEVALGRAGEILVRGPTVAVGAAAEDGWLHTGDLGRVDGEGHLWITGRMSDRILTGGVTVDPGEVEAVLRGHQGVAEVAVVGFPDEEWGELVVAVVVGRTQPPPGEEELSRLARSVLSSPKRPRAFRFVASLPRNANGKVDREALRALFR